MRRAVLLVSLIAVTGCVRGTGGRHASASDECFERRDRLRGFAPRDAKAAASLVELEARCARRAEILIADATQHFLRQDTAGGRALLDRALALAARDSREFARADQLRKLLDQKTAGLDRNYEQEAQEAEAVSDWPAAREAYRAAIDAGRVFPGVHERLAHAEQKCIEAARRALAEGRSAEASHDLESALGAFDRVFELLDDPQAAEYREAEESQVRVEIAIEKQEDDGIDEPPTGDVAPREELAAAEEAEHRHDWIAARNAYRQISARYPNDPKPKDDWARTQAACLAVARREIVMARAYEAALNYGEAAKSIASALRCADAPHLAEYAEARRLLENIRSQNLPSPSLLALPTGREELLRFGDVRSHAQDWITAREAFRRAAETAPGDAQVTARVAEVEAECLRHARRYISEAKAYEAASNYPEALTAARSALLYADMPATKEHQLARDIEHRLHVEMAYP